MKIMTTKTLISGLAVFIGMVLASPHLSAQPNGGLRKPTIGDTVKANVYADNTFEMYINGKLVAVDSITFIPHNVISVDMLPTYPMTIAVLARDNADPKTGMEYANTNIGDGGFILKLGDGTVTSSKWKAKRFFWGPLNGDAKNPKVMRVALPQKWNAIDFDDSTWGYAKEYTEEEVGPKAPFFEHDFKGAKFIWSNDIKLDNTVIFRYTVKSPPDGKARLDFTNINNVVPVRSKRPRGVDRGGQRGNAGQPKPQGGNAQRPPATNPGNIRIDPATGLPMPDANAGSGRQQRPRGQDGGGQRAQGGRQQPRGQGGGQGRSRNPIILALDTDEDGELSVVELQNAPAALRGLDRNKDGQLSREETRPADGQRGGQGGQRGGGRGQGGQQGRPQEPRGPGSKGPGPKGQAQDGEVRQPWLFVHGKEIDADGNGIISRQEMLNQATAAFGGYDRNRDGIIVADELNGPGARGAMAGFLKGHAREIDANNDSRISVEELLNHAERMFGKGDRNQDGMITKEELAGMQRNPGQQPPRRNPRQ